MRLCGCDRGKDGGRERRTERKEQSSRSTWDKVVDVNVRE